MSRPETTADYFGDIPQLPADLYPTIARKITIRRRLRMVMQGALALAFVVAATGVVRETAFRPPDAAWVLDQSVREEILFYSEYFDNGAIENELAQLGYINETFIP